MSRVNHKGLQSLRVAGQGVVLSQSRNTGVGGVASIFKKAAPVISKLQLPGAEPETLTVRSLYLFLSFWLLKMRRKRVTKQAFYLFIFFPPGDL